MHGTLESSSVTARALSARAVMQGVGLVAVMTIAVLVGWIGFTASDDSLYFVAAERWLDAPPFAGDNHWATRFPLLWSFAAMLALFGRGFAAFAATALLWYSVLVAVVGAFTARVGGARAGWIAALLTATMPVIVGNATTVSVDLIEAALLLGGGWLIGEADDDLRGMWRGAAAGVCFGAAILCRETALLSLVAFGPLFLIGRPVPRRVLIAAGVGLAAVLGGEALFQYAQTGAPLRRYDIAFHHDSHIDRAANMEGNLLLHPAIDPLLVLLVNDDFGAIFWVAAAATAIAWRTLATGSRALMLGVVAAMALADFLLVAVLTHKLVLNPRYFTLPALLAAVVAALWLARCSVWMRRVIVAGLITTNLLLMSVGNAHPRWGMEALVAACRAHPAEPIFADPVSVRRARVPLRFAGLDNARYVPAPPGGLLVVPEATAPVGLVVARYPSPPTRLGAVLTAVHADAVVPGAIRRRMFAPNPTMVLVRAR